MAAWSAKLAKKSEPKPVPRPEGKSKSPKSTSPAAADTDGFNAAETLTYLSGQYSAAVAAAKKDKLGEKVRIYRSLDALSGWNTKSRKGPAEEDRYNLLQEVNRSMLRSKKN